MSAEDPEGRGVEQQPGDEEQQVEVGVHLVHALLPTAHVAATSEGRVEQGRVEQGLLPCSGHFRSQADARGLTQTHLVTHTESPAMGKRELTVCAVNKVTFRGRANLLRVFS